MEPPQEGDGRTEVPETEEEIEDSDEEPQEEVEQQDGNGSAQGQGATGDTNDASHSKGTNKVRKSREVKEPIRRSNRIHQKSALPGICKLGRIGKEPKDIKTKSKNSKNKGQEVKSMGGERLEINSLIREEIRKYMEDIKEARESDSEESVGWEERRSETDSEDSSEDSSEESDDGDQSGGVTVGSYFPSSLPLHTWVGKAMKKKVWSLKYVDFQKFLDKEERQKSTKTFEIVRGKLAEVEGEISDIRNFRKWDKAFMSFLSIHAANPRRISGLFRGHD